MLVCSNCSNPIDAKTKFCPYCDAPVEITYSATKDASGAVVPGSSQISALMNRYKDAYLYARVTVGVGSFVKGIGIVLGILLFVVGFATGSIIRSNPIVSLMAGVIMGGIVGVFFYIWGILVSAVGQILKASLDGAVNSSPFLANEHKARIMSLPQA